MIFTKTDFIQYLSCPESLWLLKNRPEDYPIGEFSLFLEKLIKEGYEVEKYAKQLFPSGIDLPEKSSAQFTKEQLNSGNNVFFQPSFITSKGVFARIDVLEKLDDGSYHIYEIKSSTSIKKDNKHNHLKDICFQKYVIQECGYNVTKVSIINLNKEYVRQGNIIAEELLNINDVSSEIEQLYSTVVNEINAGVNFINKGLTSEEECICKYKTRSNHCDSFSYFNKDVPDYSIYEIGRISAKKVIELVEKNNVSILDIPLDFELNTKQQIQVESVRQETAIINQNKIDETISKLKFPLHFIDYETYASAIPHIDGLSPHKHLVFQVSIHTLNENGDLFHYEWLGEKMELPREMLNQMQEFTGLTGTFISWHASFEIGRNKDMIDWIPEYSNYLTHINENMFDLEKVFMEDYVDYRFHGSTSIKKVFPVLCPNLSYKGLVVQDGTMALDTWGRMVLDPNFLEDIELTRKNLLDYCELDTMAMVKIYKILDI